LSQALKVTIVKAQDMAIQVAATATVRNIMTSTNKRQYPFTRHQKLTKVQLTITTAAHGSEAELFG
jgi:hypothetical protein